MWSDEIAVFIIVSGTSCRLLDVSFLRLLASDRGDFLA